ncbi:MAG: hypothetical protein MJK04_28715, partial [Psychrosphaera sp.]|nr:hypothetical protein [Psychrosphaera sp.]
QMDFNLDGITDFIGFTDPTQRGYVNNGINGKVGFAYYNGAEMVTATGNIDYFCSTNGYYKTTDTTQGGVVTTLTYRDCSTYVIDVNKDGKMDLMVSEQTAANTNNWVVYLNTYEPSFDANGNDINKGTISFDKVSGSFTTTGTDGFDAPLQIMDINGDGYDDLVGQYEYQPTTNAGGAHWTWAAFTPTYSPGTGISNDSIVFTEMTTYKVNRHAGVVAEQMVDINQDGLVDYLYSDYDVRLELFRNNTYHIRLNNGKDFDAPVAWSQQLTGKIYFDQDDNPLDLSPYVKVLDYNRDGVMDLIVPDTRAAKAWCASTGTYCHEVDPTYDLYHWKVWLGQHGTIDFVEQAHQLNIIAPLIDLSFSDFNGDGYVDAVTRLGRLASPPYYQMNGNNAPGIHVYTNQNAETDLIKTITDGMDMITEFDYDVLSMTPVGNDPPLYNVDFKRSQFPYNNFATTDTVVSQMRTSTGLAADPFNTTKFYYSEARFHKQGRGFQGFGVIEEVNVRADITTKTEYAQNFPYSGMVEQQWTYLTGQNNITHFLSWSQNSDFTDARVENAVTEAGEHPLYLPYAKSSTSISKEIGIKTGAVRAIGVTKSSSLSNKTVDGNGNLTDSTSLVCDGTLGSLKDCAGSPWKKETTTTVAGYILRGGAYKPTSSSTESTVTYADQLTTGNDTLKITKAFNYDTSTGNVLDVTTTDATPGSTAPSLKQAFAYYPAGHHAAGQLKRVTSDNVGAPTVHGIEGDRWVQTTYSNDGYFVTSTNNSQWGEGDSNKASSQTVLATTGQVDTQTDVNGNIATTIYDGYHRAIRVSTSHTSGTALSVPDVTSGIQSCLGKASGSCTNTFGLDEVYRTVTKQAVSQTAYTYLDKAGRVLRHTTTGFNDELIESSTKYDTQGRVLEQESDAGTVTFTGFDALNRPLSKNVSFDPQNYDVTFDYKGLTTEMEITPRGTHGNTTPRYISRTVNSAGKLMTSVDEAGNSTKYRYNAAGLPTIIQGPTGVKTTAVYNALGHKLSMSDPNQGTMAFVYNALGELRRQTDAVGTITTFNYDKLGRTVTRTPLNGEAATSWVFDTLKKGQLTEASLSNGLFKKTYTYDDLARMTQTTTTIEGTDYVQDTTLDPNFGRPTSTTSPDSTRVFYHYKLNGFLQKESDSANPSATALRTITATDKNGLITGAEYRNRLITTTSRTISGAITRICTTNAGADCAVDNSAQHIQYQKYDSFGNLGKRANHSQGVTEVFTYDVQDRLTKTEKSGFRYDHTTASNADKSYSGFDTDFAYNHAGNLTKKTDFSTDLNGYSYGNDGANALKVLAGSPATSVTYAGPNAVSRVNLNKDALNIPNAPGRYMDFAYDKNGNLTKKTLSYTPAGGTPSAMTYREIKYNSNNKPIEVSNFNGETTYFYYGSDGMRYK